MADRLTLRGMVISATPLREYDKRVVLLTGERGKITVFCRGARSPKSQLSAATQPFAFGDFILLPGKDAYTLVGAEITEWFDQVRQGLTATGYGLYFLELAAYFSKENLDGTQMLNLVYQTLLVLGRKQIDAALIRRIFELKVLVIEGEYPGCFSCSLCGSTEGLGGFSFQNSGVVCASCASKVSDYRKLHPSTIYAMQVVVSADIQKLYRFTVIPQVQQELADILDRFLRQYVDRPMKTLAFLETLGD